MALKFWRENFYVLFPVPCSSFPEKSGNSRELPGSHFREFPNWHNLIYTLFFAKTSVNKKYLKIELNKGQ